MGQYNKILTIRMHDDFYNQLYRTVKSDNEKKGKIISHTTAGVIRCLVLDYLEKSQQQRERLLKEWSSSRCRKYELFNGKHDNEK